MSSPRDKDRFTPFHKQFFGSLSAVLITASSGACIGYSSILLPQLQKTPTFIEVNLEVESWIASILSLSMLLGNMLGGILAGRFGRKATHQLISVFVTVGWFLIAYANTLPLLLSGRFLSGFGVGIHMPVASMYIGEITSPQFRGFFLAWISVAMSAGLGVCHLLGTFVHWKTVALAATSLSFVSGSFFSFIPDSPSWLVSRGQFAMARDAFRWYRGSGNSNEVESMIERKVNEMHAHKVVSAQLLMSTISKAEFYKPVFILTLFMMMLQFSGSMVVSFYAVQIITDIFKGEVNAYAVMIGLDGLRIVASVAACVALKYAKRRSATLISGLLAASSMSALIVYIYLKEQRMVSEGWWWFPLTTLSLYMVSISLGIIPLPWCLLGELLPLGVRSSGATLCTVIFSLLLFISSKTAPSMIQKVGIKLTFSFYTVVTAATTATLMFVLPETKGKTLQEIEEGFKSKRSVENATNNLYI